MVTDDDVRRILPDRDAYQKLARNLRGTSEFTHINWDQSMWKIDLEPMDDRLVIEQAHVRGEEVRESGIVLPEIAREKPEEGTIVAAGPGRRGDDGKRVPLAVKVGDVVLYGKYSGIEIKHQGKPYLIVREADILAKLPQ